MTEGVRATWLALKCLQFGEMDLILEKMMAETSCFILCPFSVYFWSGNLDILLARGVFEPLMTAVYAQP